ncbi:unnamed protein product [Rotaria magnacalcarata]|uniref:BTB domain-containing protein n=1 Tax=Rotaria magnacalcarata TaxID=392030 RepID=A0A819GTM0_9BILA|nr:unnamed protein product [Rotaria magnacalcarata]CAF2123765.1 unnamed protein product [Rotaria magnacalcarata]CAF3891158.1 unnamed protein product [Rotaria magnacalcarata]CAF3938857.1 unnamed protein product [Rotaria magnacalcarata]
MTETAVSLVVIEPVETIDNETMQLTLKCENFNLHGIQTLKCLDAMRKERQLCDVILTVEGHELFVHRAVLSCHSNYFLELFVNDEKDTSTKKQIYYQLDGLEHPALKLIIQFIYRGSFQLTSDMVPKVYLAAHQLRVETIFKACSNYLAEQLNKYNCLITRLMAIDDELRMKASEFIQNNFFAVIETREFHALPSIKVELVGATILNTNIMCDLIINWISQQLRKDNSSLQELEEYLHLLYLNGDKTLHDCSDMDKKNVYFSDLIKDYQSYKLSKRTSISSISVKSSDNLIFATPNLKLVNNTLPSNITNNLQTFETTLIHIDQSTEYSYVAIGIVKGKMISISIHLSSSLTSTPITSENGHTFHTDDNDHIENHTSPVLPIHKEIPLASLSIPRCCFGVISTNNKIFVVGGYDRGDCLDTIEQFNPIDGKWKILSAPMNSRRGRVSAAMVNNRIYVCGGSDGQQELFTGEYYDLKSMNKWLPIKDLDTPVAHGAMCSDDSYIYLIGGCEGDKCKNDCYRYDPDSNQWSTLSSMNRERSQAAAVYFDGKIYVFGGYTSNRCLSSCEILTLSTNEWSAGPGMRENRRGCGAVLYENRILIIGGSNGIASLTSIEIFDPAINEWITNINGIPNELNVSRVGVGITVCDGKVYVMGGFDGRNFLKTIEVYDKNNQRWKLSNNKLDKMNYQNSNDVKM